MAWQHPDGYRLVVTGANDTWPHSSVSAETEFFDEFVPAQDKQWQWIATWKEAGFERGKSGLFLRRENDGTVSWRSATLYKGY